MSNLVEERWEVILVQSVSETCVILHLFSHVFFILFITSLYSFLQRTYILQYNQDTANGLLTA